MALSRELIKAMIAASLLMLFAFAAQAGEPIKVKVRLGAHRPTS